MADRKPCKNSINHISPQRASWRRGKTGGAVNFCNIRQNRFTQSALKSEDNGNRAVTAMPPLRFLGKTAVFSEFRHVKRFGFARSS